MTELSNPTLIDQSFAAAWTWMLKSPRCCRPPCSQSADANRYWERLQGMRVQVPQNSIVLGGRNVFSPADAEIWVAAPDSTIAQRSILTHGAPSAMPIRSMTITTPPLGMAMATAS